VEISARTKKEKSSKKERNVKEGEVYGNCRSRGNRARKPFGNILLMISSAAWKILLGFPQLPQTRRRLINKPEF
jgi:hypothetical protein